MLISIIVCTRNRPDSLIKTLESITQAIGDMKDIKAIIVDNGSSRPTFEIIRIWASQQSFVVRMLYERKRGLSRARNTGIRHAVGAISVFIDDDCRLAPDYFIILKQHYENDKEAIIRGGKVELGDPNDLPFTIKTTNEIEIMSDIHHPGGFILGANMVIPMDIFMAIGLFDERFGVGSIFKTGEDTEFIHRAYRAGFQIKYEPDMVVKHFHGRKKSSSIIKLLRGYAIGNGALYAKYFPNKKLLRQFYWDCKIFFIGKSNTKDKILFCNVILGNIYGMILYLLYSIFSIGRYKP